MKALVIGSTGMIGSEFVRSLRNKKYEVFGIARPTSTSRLNAVADKSLIYCDILDEGSLEKVISSIKC